MAIGASPNFDFLKAHDPQLVRLGALAERYFRDDPNGTSRGVKQNRNLGRGKARGCMALQLFVAF